MFRQMPVLLLALIALISLAQPYVPLVVQAQLLAVSLFLKNVIVFILPFIIFSLLFKAMAQMASQASRMVALLLLSICLSNFLSTLTSYTVGHFGYQLDLCAVFPDETLLLVPSWQLDLPKWIANDHALFSGLILGLTLGRYTPKMALRISSVLDIALQFCLKTLLYIIPLFLLGFVLKMNYEGVMGYIASHYGPIFILITASVFTYICLIYLIASQFKPSISLTWIKNMLPAALAGFSSMSSAAAMPLTLLATEKNAKHPALSQSVIPATVNVHLIGDCFAIPVFAFAVLKTFGVEEPSFSTYLLFASYFVLAKFSVAAVPGGGILVMIPILESFLGFNTPMTSLITALYILFDPVITCANVLGNGAFALIFDKFFGKSLQRP